MKAWIQPYILTSLPARYLLAGCFVMLLAACSNDLKQLPPDATELRLQNDKAEEVEIIFSEQGVIKAVLHSKVFVRNDQATPPYADFKEGIKVDFYNAEGQVESTLTARSARYFTASQNVVVRDSVVVINKKGEKLQTEELVWNQKVERFYSEKLVRITIDNQVTYGDGIEANQDFTWYRISRQRGAIPVDETGLPDEASQ